MDRPADPQSDERFVSTGRLPSPEEVQALVDEAYARFRSNDEGSTSDVYPALARAPAELFGICVVGTSGAVYAAGDAEAEFAIITVSPGKGGLGTCAPLLDEAGNSVKGQLVARFLSRRLGLDLFSSEPDA